MEAKKKAEKGKVLAPLYVSKADRRRAALEQMSSEELSKKSGPKGALAKMSDIPILAAEKNVVEFAKALGTSQTKAKRLLREPAYFKRWISEADVMRSALSYTFIIEALKRMKSELSQASYLALAKSFGITSDKLVGEKQIQLQQVNISGGEKKVTVVMPTFFRPRKKQV